MMYVDLPPAQLSTKQPPTEIVRTIPADYSTGSPLDTLLASVAASSNQAVSTQLPAYLLAQTSDENLPSLESPPTPGVAQPDPLETETLAPPSDENEPLEPAPEEPAPEEPEGPEPVDSESAPIEIETGDDLTPEAFASQLRLTADFQEYDPVAQVITAQGNVVLRLNDAIIETDELWLNLVNRYVLADGEVLLTRGSQIVRGSRAEYNFIQQAGVISGAVGTLFLPEVGGDLSNPLEGSSPATRRAYDPLSGGGLTVDSDGSVRIASRDSTRPTGSSDEDGGLRQLRFETDELTFDVEGWRASAVRITNDPFSPPELEVRAEQLLLRNVSPTQDELLLKNARIVFDDGLAIPLLRRRILLSRGSVNTDDLNPVPVSVGIDGSDRGGFYIGRKVPIIQSANTRFSVTPQFFAARAFGDQSDSPFELDNFGFTADLRSQLTPTTTLRGSADLASLNPRQITEKLRTSVRAEQEIGDHRLTLQYSYRERLFNGTLGFQDVQSSLGAVLLSPEIRLGENGPALTYQTSAQLINAESDRPELISNSGRATLGRFQASAALRKDFNLWRGEPKPATQNEGLRYTPEPVVPYLNLITGIRATGTYYSSGDFQDNLVAEIGIEGQVGHLVRNFGDYTRFKAGYSQSFIGGANSPFLFDREVDRNILTLGIAQQIYGPFLAGVEAELSLNEDRAISTIYSLEYSRRTYGVLLLYDTAQNTGSVGFRLSNFSWVGDTNPFDSPRIRRVRGGIIERP